MEVYNIHRIPSDESFVIFSFFLFPIHSFIQLNMSTRNRMSTTSASKVDHPSLALTESYDEEIAPLLTTIDQSKSLSKYFPDSFFFYFKFEIESLILIQQLIYQQLL